MNVKDIFMVIIGILSLIILYKIINGGLVEGAEDTPLKNVNCSNIILSNDQYKMCEKMSKTNNNRVCVDNDTKVCSGVTLKKNESCETKSDEQTTCNIDDIPKPNQKPAGENTDAIDKACSRDGGSPDGCFKECQKNKKYCCLNTRTDGSDAGLYWFVDDRCGHFCESGDLDRDTCCDISAEHRILGHTVREFCSTWNIHRCRKGSKYEECCDFADHGGDTIKLKNNLNRCSSYCISNKGVNHPNNVCPYFK